MKKVKEIIKAIMKNWQGCEPCIYSKRQKFLPIDVWH